VATEASNTAETADNGASKEAEPDPDPDGALAEALLASAFSRYSQCGAVDCTDAASHLLFCYRCSASYPTCAQHIPTKAESDVVLFPCEHVCLTEGVQSWPL